MSHRESMSPGLAAKMEAIPVYPDEVSLAYLNKKFGVYGLPADAPVGEDDGWVCYPSARDKDTYMSRIGGLVLKYHQKNRTVRAEEKRGQG